MSDNTAVPAYFNRIIDVVKCHYQTQAFIPLHAPCVGAAEKAKLNDCIDSTFVSSVGQFVTDFENTFAQYTGAKHALSVVNGTMGLFLALKVLGVKEYDLVLTQSLTFVATANAIKTAHAEPVFIDVDKQNLGLCPKALSHFLETQTEQKQGVCVHKGSGKKIKVCMPMHTLGFVGDIEQIVDVCHKHNIKVIEDAAESLGSFKTGSDINEKHSGTIADIGVFSFNGNKIITTGGGGMLITNNRDYAAKARHLGTTAKLPHAWLFEHDEVGYNLRMPNINAALGLAQFQQLNAFLTEKRDLARFYQTQFSQTPEIRFIAEPKGCKANQWLNAILFKDQLSRDAFLEFSNQQNIQTRPLWTPMHQLEIYQDCLRTDMSNTEWLAQRVVNIPSGVRCHG